MLQKISTHLFIYLLMIVSSQNFTQVISIYMKMM